MSETAKRIRLQLAALPATERAELAAFLLDSLHEEQGEQAEKAWEAELERRWQAYVEGKSKGVPAEEVFARLSEKRS
jgi:putative addiction module component (TIGR02574 family)